jgi:hypothetical protein
VPAPVEHGAASQTRTLGSEQIQAWYISSISVVILGYGSSSEPPGLAAFLIGSSRETRRQTNSCASNCQNILRDYS